MDNNQELEFNKKYIATMLSIDRMSNYIDTWRIKNSY